MTVLLTHFLRTYHSYIDPLSIKLQTLLVLPLQQFLLPPFQLLDLVILFNQFPGYLLALLVPVQQKLYPTLHVLVVLLVPALPGTYHLLETGCTHHLLGTGWTPDFPYMIVLDNGLEVAVYLQLTRIFLNPLGFLFDCIVWFGRFAVAGTQVGLRLSLSLPLSVIDPIRTVPLQLHLRLPVFDAVSPSHIDCLCLLHVLVI